MNKSEIYDALMTVSNLFGLSSEKDEWTKITQQYIQVHSLIEKYSNKKDVVKKKYFSWQSNDTPKQKIAFTVEFFPEEGKYHFTGHRNCGVKQSPKETDKDGVICPTCKKKLTIGVMHRVEQLAHKDRPEVFRAKERPPFKNLVPLLEILAESLGSPVGSERVAQEYRRLIDLFGSEIVILLKTPIADLEKQAISRVAEGIKKVREGDIVIEPGFDGVYGVVKIWPGQKKARSQGGSQSAKPEKSVKQAGGQVRLFE